MHKRGHVVIYLGKGKLNPARFAKGDVNVNINVITDLLPSKAVQELNTLDSGKICEIRMRINRHTTVNLAGRNIVTRHIASKDDIVKCIQRASGCSVYAFTDEIKNGFLTVKGGHRIGICGRASLKNGVVSNIVDFNSVNIRIAKEIRGCGERLAPLAKNGSMLIVSPPGCGKTTVLRDIGRILGQTSPVSIVDERGEIAACLRGEPQFDVGEMTDILDLCPKKTGIEIVLRAMSPEYIITDEIARDDLESVNAGIQSGVKFIASAHGSSIDEALSRLNLCRGGSFKTVVLLGEKGKIIKTERNEGTAV